MTQAIYEWMKNLAVFYIFLTVVMNLMPDNRYGEYMRFFMGLLLILLILAPVMKVFQGTSSVEELFQNYTSQQEDLEKQWGELEIRMEETQKLQEEYQQKLYEQSQGEGAGGGEEKGETVTENAQ